VNIMPPSRRSREVRVVTRPKALVLTSLAIGWGLIAITAWSADCSRAIRIGALAVQVLLLGAAVCLWRFERPRQVRLPAGLHKPPVIHGS
jgi:hypothetical protein